MFENYPGTFQALMLPRAQTPAGIKPTDERVAEGSQPCCDISAVIRSPPESDSDPEIVITVLPFVT